MVSPSIIDNTLFENISEKIIEKLEKGYFRIKYYGEENAKFNDDRPVVFVLNHSGMSYPWDGLIFGLLFKKLFNAFLRINVSKESLNMSLVSPANILRRLGGIENNLESIDVNLKQGKFLAMFPEGTPGITKGFNRRYQLQKYQKSFIYMAIKHKAHLVPVNVVNAEFLLPFMYRSNFINKISQALGLAFSPLGVFTLFFIFPAFIYFVLPAKLTYVFHNPIEIFYDKEKVQSDYQFISKATSDFQIKQQQLLNEDIKKYHIPYNWKEFFHSFLKSKNKKIFFPFFWHEYLCDALGLGWHIKLFYKLPIIGWLLLLIFLPKNKVNN